MADLKTIAADIRKRLDRKDAAREAAIKASREIIRECRGAISAIQSKRDPKKNLSEARTAHKEMRKKIAQFPELLYSGYVVDAEQELTEAEILTSSKKGMPTPDDIGVSDEAFVLGLADAIGEFRRLFLDRLMSDRKKEAERLLGKMEEYYSVLMTFNYPDAIIATKKKQDVARSLLEKSRSELLMATHVSRLRKRR